MLLSMETASRIFPTEPGEAAPAIMVVEDEAVVLQVISLLLASQGFHVLSAQGQDEAWALHQAHSGKIRLLLTDMRLRQGSGVELGRKLSAARPGISIIYMSGYPLKDFQAGHALMDEAVFLAKPFLIETFMKLIGKEFGPGTAVSP